MRRSIVVTICLIFSLCAVSPGMAGVPQMINFQGRLTDQGGNPLNDTLSITFSIYDDSTDGTQLWSETSGSVIVSDGIFNVLLGSVNPIPDSVFTGAYRWLGMKVETDPEMRPLQPIASVGYAFHSATSDTAEYARVATSDGDWDIDTSGFNIYRLTGNVGIGTTTPGQKLDVDGTINVGNIVTDGNSIELSAGLTGDRVSFIDFHGDDMWTDHALRITRWYGGANAASSIVHRGTGPLEMYAVEAAPITFMTSNTERLRIDSGGNVGIGTTSPSYKLDVQGYVQAYGYYTGDIVFQKDQEKLWRMYEGEDGLYLENLKSGKTYRFVLQEVESE